MSTIYNLEPPTKGKVVLKTTFGELEIELWAKEAPKACRNFVQLCLEGYYNNTIFHRVIKNYLVQGGDPTGTGTGGESVYGEPFQDEFHSRLRFSHRGLVACANENRPHSNGSQFFVTLDKAEFLDRRNTIFGRIIGDTLFNLLRFNEISTDPKSDRPFDPPSVVSADVIWNPFDDIKLRDSRGGRRSVADVAAREEEERRKMRSRVKNTSLLSFAGEGEEEEEERGEEEEEERGEGERGEGEGEGEGKGRKRGREDEHWGGKKTKLSTGMRSAHDVLNDKKLAKEEAVDSGEMRHVAAAAAASKRLREQEAAAAAAEEEEWGRSKDKEEERGEGRREKRKEEKIRNGERDKADAIETDEEEEEDKEDNESEMGRERDPDLLSSSSAASSSSSTAAAVKSRKLAKDYQEERRRELEVMRHEAGGKKSFGKIKVDLQVDDADLLKDWQVARERFLQRRRQVGDREKDTLTKLNLFTQVLRAAKTSASRTEERTGKEGKVVNKEKIEKEEEKEEKGKQEEEREKEKKREEEEEKKEEEKRDEEKRDEEKSKKEEKMNTEKKNRDSHKYDDEKRNSYDKDPKDYRRDSYDRYDRRRRYDDVRRSDRRCRDEDDDHHRRRNGSSSSHSRYGSRDEERDSQGGRRSGGEDREPCQVDKSDKSRQSSQEKVMGVELDPNMDQRLLLPAAWRLDDYLKEEEEAGGTTVTVVRDTSKGNEMLGKCIDIDEKYSTIKNNNSGTILELATHRLSFHSQKKDVMDRSDNIDDYEVYDPLLEKAKASFKKNDAKESKKNLEWARGSRNRAA